MNIFFDPHPISKALLKRSEVIKDFQINDYIKSELLEAISLGLPLDMIYGSKNSESYNLLHLFCMYSHYDGCSILLEKNNNNFDLDTNSGNGNTAFTFLLSNFEGNYDDFISFINLFNKYNINLTNYYEDMSPLEVYLKYNRNLDKDIINKLIELSDFSNLDNRDSYLFYRLTYNKTIFNIDFLEKLISMHNIDISKTIESQDPYEYSSSIWHSLFRDKESITVLNWINKHLKFDFNYEFKDTWCFPSLNNGKSSKVKTNVLGASIISQNKNLFNFILNEKPDFVYADFFANDQKYSFFDFCIISGFAPGIIHHMKTISDDDFFNIDINKIKTTPSNLTIDKRLLMHVEKTYISLLNKKLLTLKNKTKSNYYNPKKNKI